MKTPEGHYKKLIKKLWKNPELINSLFGNKEWQQHDASDGPTSEESDKMHAYILQKISEHEDKETRRYHLKTRLYAIGKYAAAAVVVILTGLALWTSPEAPAVKNTTGAIVQKTKEAIIWTQVNNTGESIQQVRLPDSSLVKLFPKGSLKYETAFSKTMRDVYLIGKGYFKVKKNPKRPFSVYAGGLKTTALGTSFTINTQAGLQKTSVKLHTGRIVVSPDTKASKLLPIYLTKAESGLLFDREQQVASLTNRPVPIKTLIKPAMSREGNIITMKNIPLTDVIALLSESYHVKILTQNKAIKNISFTGVVNTDKESIESVLQMICLINDLSLTKGPEQEYMLSKALK